MPIHTRSDPAPLDRTFDALASHHRRAILDRLSASDIDTPDLGAQFDMSKQAFHRHLRVLEDAGLVQRQLNGRVHTVSLAATPLEGVTEWIGEIRRGWVASFNRLDMILREGKDA